ncbi:MAG: hypothetical protein GY708_22435, partial [Actinomycetia bacterium]|nr:hypothetical protein [Actinomycetes bacterium]
DAAGNVYLACFSSSNAFKITPGGTITEIIDPTGDGTNNLHWPGGIAVDSLGNVFTTSTTNSGQPEWVFKITPGGVITTFFDPAVGDGVNACLTGIFGIATDPSDNVYVPCTNSHNVFKITPAGTATQILDSTGDGAGNTLGFPHHVATDTGGNLYVVGFNSRNVFKVEPLGAITEIIDSTGDGAGSTLSQPERAAVSSSGDVYVTGGGSNNAFEIGPGLPELSVAPLIPGAELETVEVDVDLTTNGNSIAATTFSIDYDESCLSFDDTDGDADNIPD